MNFLPTQLEGAYLIQHRKIEDDRGFFARSFCAREFQEHRLEHRLAQANISCNAAAGTLRGMHYQTAPSEEVKVVRCTRGKLFDVIIDLRKESPTYCKWQGFELSESNRDMLYVPRGFAHGYQTLEPNTEIFYLVTEFYSPAHERGVRWNDSAFEIAWPLRDPLVSPKDAALPDYVL
ncbi:MAG: dTDP-4-dehydrorhamnose 3,5-epimerase [Acidobacteriota bacterium]|nr:dTDP-4-dehydrorhamnose 3,5-epimerase [Acidobacteriota bacterium]